MWGDRLYQLLLDEYMDTVPDARRHGFQAWLVAHSGVKRATIGTWWSSRKRPDLVSLAKIRTALPRLTVTQMIAVIEGVDVEVRTDPATAEPMIDLPTDDLDAPATPDQARALREGRQLVTREIGEQLRRRSGQG